MHVQLLEIDSARITINSEDIKSLLGDKEGRMDSYTENLMHLYISECKKNMSPRAGYVMLTAFESDSKEEIKTRENLFRTGKIISSLLRASEAYAFFIATAGPGPESLARTLMEEGKYLEGYIVDLVASGIADSVANQVQEQINKLALSNHMKITNRYSPGYCSWDVNEQQKLFGLFPENCCGITLSDSSLMSPIKSVSGIIGMGPSVSYQEYTCEICSMKNCMFRTSQV